MKLLTARNLTIFLTLLTVVENPDCSGKRKIGKLNAKELTCMKKVKSDFELVATILN